MSDGFLGNLGHWRRSGRWIDWRAVARARASYASGRQRAGVDVRV